MTTTLALASEAAAPPHTTPHSSPRALERIHELGRAGYRLDSSFHYDDLIWLSHPAPEQRWKFKTILIFPNGDAVAMAGNDGIASFQADDRIAFAEFVRSIPRPTFVDKVRELLAA